MFPLLFSFNVTGDFNQVRKIDAIGQLGDVLYGDQVDLSAHCRGYPGGAASFLPVPEPSNLAGAVPNPVPGGGSLELL